MPWIDTSWMYNAIYSYRNNIASLQSRNADLTDKINRLEAARRSVNAIYQDDKSFVAWVSSYDVGGSWQGSKREEFEATKRSAVACGNGYCNAVAEVYRAICNKITQLENERADGMGAISWAYQCMNNVQGQLNWALWQMYNN